MADSIDDDWETSSKSSTHSAPPESANRAPTSDDRSEHYRVNVGGDEIVVMSTLEVLEGLKVGRISAASLVWKKGMSDWAELGRIPALALLVPSAPKVPSGIRVPSEIPSAPPVSAPESPRASSEPPGNVAKKSSPLSPVTPVGARRAALPRNPVARADLSAVRSTSPPVPRPSRPSLASIHPGVLSPLGSRPVNPRPSSPVASRHDDDDDDDGVTQVVNTAKMMRQIQAHQKPATTPPPAQEPDDKALAVYERPVATLAFSEEVAEAREEKAQEPARPASLAPARIISVGPSEAPPAPPRSAPPPSRPATPPAPSSRPAASAPVQAAPPMRARLPSLPSIVVAPAPAPAAPAAAAPVAPSHVPDSVEPVTTPTPAEIGAGEQEYTHAGRRRRTLVTRNLVLASAGSALLASIVTALVVRRPEPTPLVVAPRLPATSSAVAAPPPSPARAPSPPPQETEPAVPVLSLSALPKAPPAVPKVVRPKVEVELAESPPSPAPAFLSEAIKGATTKSEKKASDDNPYAVELTDEEPPRPAKPPAAHEAAAAEPIPGVESPGL